MKKYEIPSTTEHDTNVVDVQPNESRMSRFLSALAIGLANFGAVDAIEYARRSYDNASEATNESHQ